MWKGAKDNYTEVVETGGLLIPNAVTLIKAERREGAANNSSPIQFKRRFILLATSYSPNNLMNLNKCLFVLG